MGGSGWGGRVGWAGSTTWWAGWHCVRAERVQCLGVAVVLLAAAMRRLCRMSGAICSAACACWPNRGVKSGIIWCQTISAATWICQPCGAGLAGGVGVGNPVSDHQCSGVDLPAMWSWASLAGPLASGLRETMIAAVDLPATCGCPSLRGWAGTRC